MYHLIVRTHPIRLQPQTLPNKLQYLTFSVRRSLSKQKCEEIIVPLIYLWCDF